MAVSKKLLTLAGEKEGVQFEMAEHLIGGAAIDEFEDPYPAVTDEACKRSDAVLLAAIGGCVPPRQISASPTH
jgi:3-isopropylmalate dehydrogenase